MLLAGLCSKVGLWLCSMVRLGPLASWTVQSPPVQRGCRLFPGKAAPLVGFCAWAVRQAVRQNHPIGWASGRTLIGLCY